MFVTTVYNSHVILGTRVGIIISKCNAVKIYLIIIYNNNDTLIMLKWCAKKGGSIQLDLTLLVALIY